MGGLSQWIQGHVEVAFGGLGLRMSQQGTHGLPAESKPGPHEAIGMPKVMEVGIRQVDLDLLLFHLQAPQVFPEGLEAG